MAATHNAYSDLIHLFIDGEATETERKTLFGALSDSPELQEEFSSAMELKKAFAADIMQLQPPTYLQSQIAERAGIIVAASASAASAPVVVNSVSSALSAAAPVATAVASKGLILLAIGTSIGILSTVGVMKLTSNDAANINPPAVSQSVTRQMQTAPQPVQPVITPAPAEIAKSPVRNNGRNISNERSAGTNQISKNENTASIPVENKVQDIVKDNSSNDQVPAQPVLAAEDILMPITATEVHAPAAKTIGDNGRNRDLLNSMANSESAGISRFSMHVTGISTLQLNQGRNNITSPLRNNIAGGVKYDLDPTDAVALEAGQETFPIFLANSKGGYDEHRFITWAGASWTYSAIWLELFTVHPEIRVLAAGSTAGPLAKFSGGLVLPISSRISLSSDIEETVLLVNVNGALAAGSKLGLTGSITFHF